MHPDGLVLIIICSVFAAAAFLAWRRGVARHGGIRRPVDLALYVLEDLNETDGEANPNYAATDRRS